MPDIFNPNLECMFFFFHLRTDDRINTFHDLCDIFVSQTQGGFAGLNLAHIQHIIDQAEQVMAGRCNLPGIFPNLFRLFCIPVQKSGKPHNRIHRSPNVMAHAGKKRTFGPVRLLCNIQSRAQSAAVLLFQRPVCDNGQELLRSFHRHPDNRALQILLHSPHGALKIFSVMPGLSILQHAHCLLIDHQRRVIRKTVQRRNRICKDLKTDLQNPL